MVVDDQTGSVNIVVHEERLAERLARSLKDRLFAAVWRPRPKFAVTIVHALPGRIRLAVTSLPEADLQRLAEWLRGREGVERVRPSPASDSILVWFDAKKTTALEIESDTQTADPRAWPSPTPTASGWPSAVVNSAVLAASVGLAGVVPPPVLGVAVAYTAIPSVLRATAALRERRVGVDALDVVAIGISVATGRFATAALITWLLGVGDLILARTQARARRAISAKLELDRSKRIGCAATRSSASRRGHFGPVIESWSTRECVWLPMAS